MAVIEARRSHTYGKKRILASSFFGTAVEWYDFYAYGTATALVFNTKFFPDESTTAGTITAFAIFAVGFISRPAGGLIAGHFGDRIGRRALLAISLVVMGLASTGIGLLPSYATIGPLAVIGLILLRLAQGLSTGAEWGGSATLAVEHAPRHLRGFFGSFTQTGSAAGLLMATGAFTLVQLVMDHDDFLAYGWRIPFLASAALVAVGLYIRLGIEDPSTFVRLKVEQKIAKAPVLEVFRHHRKALLVTIGMRLAQPGLFAIITVYLLSYLATRRDDSTAGVTSVMIASAIGLASGPIWGYASDRWGRRPIAVIALIGLAVFIWPFFWFLDHGSLMLLPIIVILGMNFIHDSIYGPQAAWFTEQFPVHVRYTGVSLGCQIGTVLSGGFTPVIAAALLVVGGGTPWLICLYITLLAAVSLWAALAAHDPAGDFARDPSTTDTFEEI